ncbi:MAG: FAD-dependent thymidylate synthase, partial [Methanomassiliicoccaceae archaeon]|nr:FAD-dependent thymidylate synthase [Methanomassiliicoccaceae archaeon]
RIASFSQQSQRYVSLKEPTYVIPETIRADPASLALYEKMMEEIWEAYGKLSETIPAEDARYLLPNGCTTNITITMNARELHHFFSLRCCERAQWEIRELAERMLALCKEVSPAIFGTAGPPCTRGPCPEGKLSCGHPRRPNKAFK